MNYIIKQNVRIQIHIGAREIMQLQEYIKTQNTLQVTCSMVDCIQNILNPFMLPADPGTIFIDPISVTIYLCIKIQSIIQTNSYIETVFPKQWGFDCLRQSLKTDKL